LNECTSRRPAPPTPSSTSSAIFLAYIMCNLLSMVEIFRCNSCNIQKKANEPFDTNVWNTRGNASKTFETITNICNIHMKYS
jgi:hypothetical protein